MKLYYDKKSKDPTYWIQYGFRIGTLSTTQNVQRIGKRSEILAKGVSDPLEYAKLAVKKYNEKFDSDTVETQETIDFNEKVTASDDIISKSTLKNIGYLYLQYIYEELQIKKFLNTATKDMKIQYDPDTINKILTIDRIIDPHSKLATVNKLHEFLGNIDFTHQDVLRFMDVLSQNYDSYLAHLFDKSTSIVDRNTSICYYDCTNFYFEIEKEDEEYVDPYTGEIMPGLRKYGVSKEHRPNPIVQMGLFMDKDGIPLTMDLFHGSNNEQNTVKSLEPKLLKMLKNKKIIYCADAGLGSANIRAINTMAGRAFIVTQSIKKLSDVLQAEIFKDTGYKRLSNDKATSIAFMKEFEIEKNLNLYNDEIYKEIIIDSNVDLGLFEEKTQKNGKVRTVKSKTKLDQKLIITFSRKTMEYQRSVRKKQIDRAKALLANKDPDKIKKGPNDVTRFIVRTNKKADDSYALDVDRIAEEEKYDGFYCIATSLIEDRAQDIIEINSQRYKIEDCFRVLKTNFEGRPAYHQRPDRIRAHFLICYTSLLIFRLLEKKLAIKNYHFTVKQILQTIKNMQLNNHNNMYYVATYKGSQVLNALEDVFRLRLNRKNYRLPELLKKSKKILK